MGLFLSKDYEAQLLHLEETIAVLRPQLDKNEVLRKKVVSKLMRSILFLILAYVIVGGLVVLFKNDIWFTRVHFVLILLCSFACLYSLLKLANWYFDRRRLVILKKLNKLEAQKEKKLQEVLSKHKFEHLQNLVHRFGTPLKPSGSAGFETPGALPPGGLLSNLPEEEVSPKEMDLSYDRVAGEPEETMVVREEGVGVTGEQPLSEETPTAAPLQGSYAREQAGPLNSSPAVLQGHADFNSATAPQGSGSAALQPTTLPPTRSFIDKFVDYIIGEGPNNRFALLCANCAAHNGLAISHPLPAFRCAYCGYVNPGIHPRTYLNQQLPPSAQCTPTASETVLQGLPPKAQTQSPEEEAVAHTPGNSESATEAAPSEASEQSSDDETSTVRRRASPSNDSPRHSMRLRSSTPRAQK